MIKISGRHLVLTMLLLAACSSGSKKHDEQEQTKNNDKEAVVSDETPASEMITPATNGNVSNANELQVLNDAIRSGKDEAIYKAATQVLLKTPNEIRAINALGLYHYRRGHFSASEYMFNKALKSDSNSAELHNNLGLALMAQQDLRGAIREFRKSIDLSPGKTLAAANLAAIYVKQKDYNKGLIVAEMAYKRSPNDAKVLNNYGVCLAANGKYDSAEQVYQQALKINSNQPDVLLNYSVLLVDHMKKYSLGLENINKLRFLGLSSEMKNKINVLENKAKAGLK